MSGKIAFDLVQTTSTSLQKNSFKSTDRILETAKKNKDKIPASIDIRPWNQLLLNFKFSFIL